jgi:hypothetical protein
MYISPEKVHIYRYRAFLVILEGYIANNEIRECHEL